MLVKIEMKQYAASHSENTLCVTTNENKIKLS